MHTYLYIYILLYKMEKNKIPTYILIHTFIHTLLFIYTYTFKTSIHTYIRYNVKCIIIIMYYEYVPSI